MRLERFGQSSRTQEYVQGRKKAKEIEKPGEYGDAFKKHMNEIHEERKKQHDTWEDVQRRKGLMEGEDEMQVRRKRQQQVESPKKGPEKGK